MSRDCCVALPRGAIGKSAVCNCGTYVFPDHIHLLILVVSVFLQVVVVVVAVFLTYNICCCTMYSILLL